MLTLKCKCCCNPSNEDITYDVPALTYVLKITTKYKCELLITSIVVLELILTYVFDLPLKANTCISQHNGHIFLRKPNLELEKKQVKK